MFLTDILLVLQQLVPQSTCVFLEGCLLSYGHTASFNHKQLFLIPSLTFFFPTSPTSAYSSVFTLRPIPFFVSVLLPYGCSYNSSCFFPSSPFPIIVFTNLCCFIQFADPLALWYKGWSLISPRHFIDWSLFSPDSSQTDHCSPETVFWIRKSWTAAAFINNKEPNHFLEIWEEAILDNIAN